MAGRLARRWPQLGASLWRGVYLVSVLAFLLPFVRVAPGWSSQRGEEPVYRGFELVTQGGWLLLLPICLSGAFFGLSFLRSRESDLLRGFRSSWRAALAFIAGLVILVTPELQLFLKGPFTPKVGQILSVACWALAYVAGLTHALISAIRLRASPAMPVSHGLPSLAYFHAMHVGLLIVAAVVFLASVTLLPRSTGPLDRFLLTALAFFAASIALVQHFLIKGLLAAEPWVLAPGVLATSLLLPAGLLGAGIVVAATSVWYFALPASAAVLIVTAVAGVGSLIFSDLALRRLAGEER